MARLLVAAAAAEDPGQSYRYARQARELAARVGVVRETCAVAAYQAEDWTAALTEFRAARRLTGRTTYLPLMADCERALGRLDRALDLVTGPDAKSADRATRLELRIVESGIRRDQGLPDAAVVALQGPELRGTAVRPEHARLYYAYADALLQAGRAQDARTWFGRAAEADVDGETDADDRYEELDEDFSLDDLGAEDGADDEDEAADDADLDDADGDDQDDEADADAELDDDDDDDGDEDAEGEDLADDADDADAADDELDDDELDDDDDEDEAEDEDEDEDEAEAEDDADH